MRLSTVFIFIIAFTLDVRVQAGAELTIVETPKNCLKNSDYCVIKNLAHRYHYDSAQFTLSLSPEAIIIRQSENHWSLVKGQVFIKSNTSLKFDAPYGQIEVGKGTQALIEQRDDRVVVQTIFGKTYLKPLGVTSPVVVAPGHENYLSKVDETLKAQSGIPQPILVTPLLKDWAFHTPSKKREFLIEIEEFKSVHEQAVKDLSILNQQIVSREISSVEEKRAAAKMRKKLQQDRIEQRRKTYYDRLLQLPENE